MCFSLIFFFFISCTSSQKKADSRLNTNISNQKETEADQNRKVNSKIEPDHLKLAGELAGRGFYDVALVQLKEAKKKDPQNAKIYTLMGKCKRENKDYNEAREDFKKAILLNPDCASAYNGLGLVYDMTEKREMAWKCYKKAVSLNPARADFYNNLGFSEIIGKRYEDAEKHLIISITLSPDFKRAKNNLAFCYIMTGKEEKAFNILKKNTSTAIADSNMKALHQLKEKITADDK